MSEHSSTGRARMRATAGILLVGALALAGCTAGGAAGADGGDGGVTTVTVMGQQNEFSAEQIAAFEAENADIKIEFIEYDETRLNSMLTAGEAPDLVRGSPSANLFARGLAAPLDDYVAESDVLSEDQMLPVADVWRWDGKKLGEGSLYGIIKDWSPDMTIWQNTALFAQAGVEPFSTTEPTSWSAVYDAATKLKAAGVEYPLGLEWAWGMSAKINTMVIQNGGTIYNDDLTEVDLQTPEYQAALQWFADFGKDGLGPTSLNPLADGWDLPVFSTGKMGMTVDGYWFGGGLQGQDAEAVQQTVSLIPAPTDGERISPVLGAVGGWIPQAAEHKDEAWRVMEYYYAGQPAVDRAKSGWGLPVIESLWDELPTELQFQKDAILTAQAELDYVQPLPDSPYIKATQWDSIVDRELQAMIQSGKSAADAAGAIETEINTLLAQGKDQLG